MKTKIKIKMKSKIKYSATNMKMEHQYKVIKMKKRLFLQTKKIIYLINKLEQCHLLTSINECLKFPNTADLLKPPLRDLTLSEITPLLTHPIASAIFVGEISISG